MTSKINRLWIGAALLLLARPVLADGRDGWYAGIASDSTHVEVFRGVGWEPGTEVDGWSLRGGYRVSRHFAVEAALLHADGLEWTEHLSTLPGGLIAHSRFAAKALQLAAAGVVPFGAIWEFHAKGGLAWSHLAGQRVLEDLWDGQTRQSFAARDRGYLLGVGFAANVTERWSVRFDYQYFAIDAATLGIGNGGDPSIDSLGVGVQYQFGRRER
jgi:opacity protein-like surface antigen